MTTRQAAEALGVSVRTVQREIQRGRLPGAVKVDGRWHIPEAALDATASGDATTTTPPDAMTTGDVTATRQGATGDAPATPPPEATTPPPPDPPQTALVSQRPRLVVELDIKVLRVGYYRYVGDVSALGAMVERFVRWWRRGK